MNMNLLSASRNVARLGAVAAAIAFPLAAHAAPTAPGAAGTLPTTPDGGRYVLPFDVLEGRPAFEAGDGLGYWLWHDQDGLHLRVTTHGLEHDFNGVIRTAEQNSF